MTINRRELCKRMLAALTVTVFCNGKTATASETLERAYRNSSFTRSLLRRASQASNITRADRVKISEFIRLDYSLTGTKAPEIVWFDNLGDFVTELLQSSRLQYVEHGIKRDTIVTKRSAWTGSLRSWQQYMQTPENYDWHRYHYLYETITTLLISDCTDTICDELESPLASVRKNARAGRYSSSRIDRAECAIWSIDSLGVSYGCAVSLIDAAILAGIEQDHSIIKEMMMPIEVYDLGLRYTLPTDGKLLCVERSAIA